MFPPGCHVHGCVVARHVTRNTCPAVVSVPAGHYLGITQALLEGNLKDLQAEIDRYEAFFVQWGLYPILMRLRPIAYRNLFKKVAAALKLSPKVEGKAHIIDLAAFKTVLTFSAQDTVGRPAQPVTRSVGAWHAKGTRCMFAPCWPFLPFHWLEPGPGPG